MEKRDWWFGVQNNGRPASPGRKGGKVVPVLKSRWAGTSRASVDAQQRTEAGKAIGADRVGSLNLVL